MFSIDKNKDNLSVKTRDMNRAIDSLSEEMKAVDWYQQRADVTADMNLKGVLLHNMNEELEHAAMLLEWIRQQSPQFSKELKKYLFSDSADISKME